MHCTPYFPIHLHQLQQPCASDNQVPLSLSCAVPGWMLYSQPLLHIVIAHGTSPTDAIFGGSKEVEIWSSKIWAAMWVGEEQPIRSFFLIIPVFSALRVWSCVVLLKEDWNNNVRGRNLLQSFCTVYEFERTDLTSWFDHVAHTPKLLLMHSTNSDHEVSCWRGSLELLLPTGIWVMTFHWLSLRLQFKMMDPCFNLNDDKPW